MNHDDLQPDKRPWRTPEMIDVGGALDLTQAVATNLRESPSQPPTYDQTSARKPASDAEVDFEE